MDVYIGVDWARRSAVCTFGVHGNTQTITVEPHPSSVSGFLSFIRASFPHATSFHLAVESGYSIWPRLFRHAGFLVYLIDARQAKRFLESLSPSGAKDDRRDSYGLFLLAQSPQHCKQPLQARDSQLDTLEKLGKAHEKLTQQKTAELQRLRQLLADMMPQMADFFAELDSRAALAFFSRWSTPRKVCRSRKKGIYTFGFQYRLRHITRDKLWAATRVCFDLFSDEESKCNELIVKQMISRIRALKQSIGQLEKEMKELFSEVDESNQLGAIKGLGPILGSILVSEVLSKRSDKRDGSALLAGACPLTKQSGKKRGKRSQEPNQQVHMRKTISPRLRRMTYLLGLQLIANHDWAKAQYQHKRSQGKSAGCAFRVVVRSFLRIIDSLLKSGEKYERNKYVKALKKKGVGWAMELEDVVPTKNAEKDKKK
jgi:transposase